MESDGVRVCVVAAKRRRDAAERRWVGEWGGNGERPEEIADIGY